MKKKFLSAFLIFVMLMAVVFTAMACNKPESPTVFLSFAEDTGVISWYHKDADRYLLQIYEKDNDEPIFSMEFTSASDNSLTYSIAGEYKIILKVFSGEKEIASGELNITVKENKKEENNPPEEYEEPDSDKDEPAKILKKNYYYKKSDGDNLSIRLVNASGVKSVDAFGHIDSTMWSYDRENNALIIKPSYFQRFSVGAELDMSIEFNDSEVSKVNLQVVDVLPLDVIGGEDGVLEVDTSSLALSFRIALGYDGKTLKEGSSRIVNKVCIDGKKRDKSDYLTESGKASISLYATQVLNSLTSGLHYVEIYTTYGKSEVWLNVSNSKKNFPCNVQIDFDSSYPDVFITWDNYRNNVDYYIVEIGSEEYNSQVNSNLFDGNSFNASGKISYGDRVVVKAVYDGIAQFSDISKAAMNVNIASPTIAQYLSYDKSFEFLGKRNNYYINDFDEFFDMVYYGLLFYDELENSSNGKYEKMITFYPNQKAISNVGSSLTQVEKRLNEAVKYTKMTERYGDNGAYRIHLKVQSSFVPDATPDVTTPPIRENDFQDTHFSSTGRADGYDDFAINKVEKQASVRLSEELYLAVERGVRPVPIAGSSAYTIYETAKQVLRQIIDDDMNDYQKVHAMYDYLGKYVTYDWDINTKMSGIKPSDDDYNKFYTYRQFYLEGVFIDGVAVCNGIAKAMSLMCGIEGITCYKIKGESSGGAHAWTKVKIEDNWYVVDATWANRPYNNTYTQNQNEILAHHTIFMSEQSSGNSLYGKHYESYLGRYSDYYAGEDYNVFANTFFTVDSNLYDYVIDSKEKLKILIDYYKGYCKADQFITIDVSCNLSTLKTYLSAIKDDYKDCYIEVSNYNGAMNGVSSVIISKR